MATRPKRSPFSWRLGQVRGVEIFVHATFALLLIWLAGAQLMAGEGALAALSTVIFVLAVFGCVVLHEFGHALMGARFGFPARDITLYPIGGVARLERFPENPWQELAIAVAGPAVNLVIAAAIGVGLWVSGTWVGLHQLDATAGPLLPRLALVNVALALFNMIPAFPTDGGRVLRALLATRTDRVTATATAARVGRVFAVGLGLMGAFGNPILVLIAAFIWIAGVQETSAVQTKAATRGATVESAMMRDFHVLHVSDSLDAAERALLAGADTEFPVLDTEGKVRGVLGRDALLLALAERPFAGVAAVMTDVGTVDHSAELSEQLERLAAQEGRPLVVLEGERVVGLLTAANLGEYVAVKAAHAAAQSNR